MISSDDERIIRKAIAMMGPRDGWSSSAALLSMAKAMYLGRDDEQIWLAAANELSKEIAKEIAAIQLLADEAVFQQTSKE